MDDIITVNGLRYKRDYAEPKEVAFCYMYDNHTFKAIKGKTLKNIVDKAKEIAKANPYGMLCSAILSSEDGEIRRVGGVVHADKELGDTSEWLKDIEADSDIMELLEKGK